MNLAGESTRVFRVPDQSPVDAKGREDGVEGVEAFAVGVLEPSVDGLPSGREDRRETPAEPLPEPSHEGERIGEMAGEVGGGLGPASVLAIEVEDDEGGAGNPGTGAGGGSGLPRGRRGHGAKGIGRSVEPVLYGAPAIPKAGAGLVNGAGPDEIGRRKERGKKSARIVGGIVGPGRRVLPEVGGVPSVARHEVGATVAGESF